MKHKHCKIVDYVESSYKRTEPVCTEPSFFDELFSCILIFKLSCGHLVYGDLLGEPKYCSECGAKVIY